MTNIKNNVIWALVIVNVFFLTFFIQGRLSDGAVKANALRDLSALFENNGIALDTEDIHEGAILPEYTLTRDRDGEKALAEALLGPTSVEDQGGVIYTYVSDKGSATFRSGGEFDIVLNPGVWPEGTDVSLTVKNLLKTLKLETLPATVGGDKGNETASAVTVWNGLPVFNCRVELTFKDGSLREIGGKRAAGLQLTPDKKTDMSSAATALISFLNDPKSDSRRCTRIFSVDAGYNLTAPGDGRLCAVWRLDTDAGIYYIDTETRKVEKA